MDPFERKLIAACAGVLRSNSYLDATRRGTPLLRCSGLAALFTTTPQRSRCLINLRIAAFMASESGIGRVPNESLSNALTFLPDVDVSNAVRYLTEL